jgi:hypothetical protein
MNARRRFLLVFAPLVMAVLVGCPSSSSSKSAPASAPPTLDSPEAILKADASDPRIQAVLASIALAGSRSTTDRYLSLRKLEEVHAPAALTVSETLATSAATSGEQSFLRSNAVAVLHRARKTPEGRAALENVKRLSAESAALAGQLERSGS